MLSCQHLPVLLFYLIILFQFSVAWKISDEKKNKDDEVLVIDAVIIMKILVLHMVLEKGHEKLDTTIWHRSKYLYTFTFPFILTFKNFN